MASSSNSIPNWLRALLKKKFFDPCLTHEEYKRHEKNMFCLDCCTSFCPYCIHNHLRHEFLQVRRYVYHEVIQIEEMEKLINCSFIQPYMVNRAKVVFLKERARCRPFRNFGNFCSSCDRSLQNEYRYCSIACKVKKVVKSEGSMAGYCWERNCRPLPPSPNYFDEHQLTPAPISSDHATSNSYRSIAGGNGGANYMRGEQRGKETAMPRGVKGVHRRKGIPCRAPFY